jgi:hypothetical protein
MAKFVNVGGDADHYFPAGHGDSLPVASGQLVDVGDVNVEEMDDCYLVGEGDDLRAWPKSRWELQGSAKKDTKTPAKDVKETAKEKSWTATQDKTDSPAE